MLIVSSKALDAGDYLEAFSFGNEVEVTESLKANIQKLRILVYLHRIPVCARIGAILERFFSPHIAKCVFKLNFKWILKIFRRVFHIFLEILNNSAKCEKQSFIMTITLEKKGRR